MPPPARSRPRDQTSRVADPDPLALLPASRPVDADAPSPRRDAAPGSPVVEFRSVGVDDPDGDAGTITVATPGGDDAA